MSAWLLLVLMSLTTYRLTRLVVRDTLPPVLWLRDHLAGGWRPMIEAEWRTRAASPEKPPFTIQEIKGVDNRWVERASWSTDWLAELITCPWCASGWVAAGVTAAVAFTVGVPAPLLVWPAVWGAGALLASRDWS